MDPQDLERIVNAIGQRDWWDYLVGVTTAAAAIASVVIAFVAVRIARNAETGRQAAERALQQERAESRLRDAIRSLVDSLHNQVRQLNDWAARPILDGLGEGSLNSQFEEDGLRLDPLDLIGIELHESAQRPRYEALRGALDNVLLVGTDRSREALRKLQTLVFTVVVAPQWHAAAQHLTDISSALARWSGRDDGIDAFCAELDQIRSHYLDQIRVAEALRAT